MVSLQAVMKEQLHEDSQRDLSAGKSTAVGSICRQHHTCKARQGSCCNCKSGYRNHLQSSPVLGGQKGSKLNTIMPFLPNSLKKYLSPHFQWGQCIKYFVQLKSSDCLRRVSTGWGGTKGKEQLQCSWPNSSLHQPEVHDPSRAENSWRRCGSTGIWHQGIKGHEYIYCWKHH